MGTSAHSTALARPAGLPLVRRGHARRLVRAPGRRGPLSPEEVAHALKAQREELRRRLDRRRDAAGVPAHAREEIVDEAIGLVVMSSKPIHDEEHLQGAFWASVGFLLMEHRSGRHELHVGSRRRMDFEPVADALPGGDDEPFDVAAARERIATAADLMAQLDPFEQRVFALMAVHKLGVKLAAKALGEPVKTVLAASRSARRKLDQVAAITAAGRMCDYRAQALRAHAQGAALAEQERAAKAHLAACAAHADLRRELRGQEFQRAASAAFLPPPALAVAVHGGLIERLTTFFATGRGPSGAATAERTAGVLGGGGLVKAAAVTSAIVVAGAGVGAKVIHSLAAPAPARHHVARTLPAGAGTRVTVGPTPVAGALTSTVTHAAHGSTAGGRRAGNGHARRQAPPSHDLGYLALGGSAGDGGSRPNASAATAASTSSDGSGGEAPAPSRTGGGTSLGYLGH